MMSSKQGRFSFENCARNALLQQQEKFTEKKAKHTGTTIAAAVFKDGVVLGADARTTTDSVVSDKDTCKLLRISDTIYCATAGMASDAENLIRLVQANMELFTLNNNGRQPHCSQVSRTIRQTLFRFSGDTRVAVLVAGVDTTGSHLSYIYNEGSIESSVCDAAGSGMTEAEAVLDDGYHLDMEQGAAVNLVSDAVAAGILSDLGSGTAVDMCILTKDKAQIERSYRGAAENQESRTAV